MNFVELKLARFKNRKEDTKLVAIIPDFMLEDKYLNFHYGFIKEEHEEKLKSLIQAQRNTNGNIAIFTKDKEILFTNEELEEVGFG